MAEEKVNKLRTIVPVHGDDWTGDERRCVVQWWEMFDQTLVLGLPSLQQAYGMGPGIKWMLYLQPEEAVALGEALIAHGRLRQADTTLVKPPVRKTEAQAS